MADCVPSPGQCGPTCDVCRGDEPPFAHVIMDARRVVTAVTPSFTQHFTCATEDIIGMRFDRLVCTRDRAGHARYTNLLATYESGFRSVFVTLAVGGSVTNARLLLGRRGDGWLAILERMEKTDASYQLLVAQQRWRAVVRSSDEGIAFLDEDRCLLEHNPRFLELLDFRSQHGVALNEESIMGRYLFSLVERGPFIPLEQALLHDNPRKRRYSGAIDYRELSLEVVATPTFLAHSQYLGSSIVVRDRTAERQLTRARIDAARSAGKAEVASEVLHNVGNILNSVAVSTDVLRDSLVNSRFKRLGQVSSLLAMQEDPASFIAHDERGQKIVPFLGHLVDNLRGERATMNDEVRGLRQHIDHMNAIIGKQQSFAGALQFPEECSPTTILREAITFATSAWCQYDIRVEADAEGLTNIEVDRHKVLMILVNLLSNAKDAIVYGDSVRRVVSIRARITEDQRVRFEVTDTGIGIAPEDIEHIFVHGVTTKAHGHGFGLHSSACAAGEMGGTLTCSSGGVGRGATFLLELPARSATGSAEADDRIAEGDCSSPAPADPGVHG